MENKNIIRDEEGRLNKNSDITLINKLIDEWIGTIDEVTLEENKYKVPFYKKRIRNRTKKNQCTNLETTNKMQSTK